MNNEIFKELVAGIDLDEMKELKGFSRYKVDLHGRVYDKQTGSYKINTPNVKGYTYHRLINDEGESVVVSLHSIVMAGALECSVKWWSKFNLVVDHRDTSLKGKEGYDAFTNLQLITQSQNLKKRKSYVRRSKFTENELKELYKEFTELDVKHGELMEAYRRIGERYNSAVITIQNHYRNYKKLNEA